MILLQVARSTNRDLPQPITEAGSMWLPWRPGGLWWRALPVPGVVELAILFDRRRPEAAACVGEGAGDSSGHPGRDALRGLKSTPPSGRRRIYWFRRQPAELSLRSLPTPGCSHQALCRLARALVVPSCTKRSCSPAVPPQRQRRWHLITQAGNDVSSPPDAPRGWSVLPRLVAATGGLPRFRG